MQATEGEEHQWTSPVAVDPVCHKPTFRTLCVYWCGSSMTVMGTAAHFLTGWEANCTGRIHVTLVKQTKQNMAGEAIGLRRELTNAVLLNAHGVRCLLNICFNAHLVLLSSLVRESSFPGEQQSL